MEERAEEYLNAYAWTTFREAEEDVAGLVELLRAIRKEALEQAAGVVFSMGAAEKIRALIEEGGPEEVRS